MLNAGKRAPRGYPRAKPMYLDEQDALRPASAPSGKGSRNTLLGGGAALLIVILVALFAALGGEDEPAAAAEPEVAPRSAGQLAAPAAVVQEPVVAAPVPPAPAVAPTPAVAQPVAAPKPVPSPAIVATAKPEAPKPAARDSQRKPNAVAPQTTEEELLQQLTERAGAFAAQKPQPAPAPELQDEPTPAPELQDEPAPAPELQDEPAE